MNDFKKNQEIFIELNEKIKVIQSETQKIANDVALRKADHLKDKNGF